MPNEKLTGLAPEKNRPRSRQGFLDNWRLKMEKLFALAAKSDAALSKRAGYETSDVRTNLDSLLRHGRVEVGYRQSCGKTDYTHHAYREWAKLLKAAEKDGLQVAVEPVKHGNSWATKSGGFWSSAIYTLTKTPNA